MVSAEDVSARLEGFIRDQGLADASFAPDRERRDVLKTELRESSTALIERVGVFETRLRKIVDEKDFALEEAPTIKDLQEKLVITDKLSAVRSSDLTLHCAEFAELKAKLK